MSRIGKQPITIPAGVEVTIGANNEITVKGPKGTLCETMSADMIIKKDGDVVTVERPSDEKTHRSLHGLTRTLIANMVVGVTEGYSKKLEIVGVGYKAAKSGKNLVLNLGHSHTITFTEDDKSPYYYCVITQNDLGNISSISTHVIAKDTTPADYTAYNEAVKKANEVNREIYENIFLLDSALKVDVTGMFSCEQDVVDAQTEAILDAISKLKKKTVKTVSLFTPDVELGIFETAEIGFITEPADIEFNRIEWYSDNMNVILVSKNGTVRCIGEGTANVHARLVNEDGSVTEGTITFNCQLSATEKIIGMLLRPIFICIYWYGLSK